MRYLPDLPGIPDFCTEKNIFKPISLNNEKDFPDALCIHVVHKTSLKSLQKHCQPVFSRFLVTTLTLSK
jgi:hypothetical protein